MHRPKDEENGTGRSWDHKVRVLEKQGFGNPKSDIPAGAARPLVLGHRGMGAGEGENTVGAFAEALRLGADGVELDVRRTADGALAVHHDAVVPGRGPVAELRVADLPSSVPLLEEVLEVTAGEFVNIEVKNFPGEPGFDPDELTAGQVAALVTERRLVGIVSSFSTASLDAFRAAAPEVATGLLTVPSHDPARALALAVSAGYSALHPHHDAVTAEVVAAAHERGLAVNTWTVNDPDRMEALARFGVDAVITDRVAAAIAALRPGGPAPAGAGDTPGR
jgi:glycerophosphoryl diester phosphodiesterase